MNPYESSIRTMAATGGMIAMASISASAAPSPADTLVITDINLTADNASISFDLNGDFFDDFQVQDNGTSGGISSLFLTKGTFGAVATDGAGTAVALAPGETVSATSGVFEQTGSLYNGMTGPLSSLGQTIYVGLRLDALVRGEVDPMNTLSEIVDIEEDVDAAFYGWAEITRGSLLINRIGFQSVQGVGAPIPVAATVPAPASLALLATGAVGLASLRRRKRTSH